MSCFRRNRALPFSMRAGLGGVFGGRSCSGKHQGCAEAPYCPEVPADARCPRLGRVSITRGERNVLHTIGIPTYDADGRVSTDIHGCWVDRWVAAVLDGTTSHAHRCELLSYVLGAAPELESALALDGIDVVAWIEQHRAVFPEYAA